MSEDIIIDQESNSPSSEGKTRAIVAHITIIGTIIAIVQNKPKDEFASFYIRQMLGLFIIGIVINIITRILPPSLGMIFSLLGLGVLVLWILSLIGAINGEKKPTPGVGQMFQDWFKSL